MVAQHQPVTLAAMEGLFETQPGAPLAIIGQPDVPSAEARQSDGSSEDAELPDLPAAGRREVKGLNAFPQDDWPDNIPLLYYATTSWWAWDDLHRGDGGVGAAAVARQVVPARAGCSGC